MRIDLRNTYEFGMNRLNTWRIKYGKVEYPYKVVLNIFYRQYTMDSIWESQLDNSFNIFKSTETNILIAHQKLEVEYSNASRQFAVGDTLINLMNKHEDIGGLNYKNNIPLISRAQNGDNKVTEELEFTYLYYLLSNEAVFMWASFGRTGYSRIDAIAQVTGFVIETDEQMRYEYILSMLGRLGVSTYMNQFYSPLPNLF